MSEGTQQWVPPLNGKPKAPLASRHDVQRVGSWLGFDVMVDPKLEADTAQLVDPKTGVVKATVRTEPV